MKTSISALHCWLGNISLFAPGQYFLTVKMEKANSFRWPEREKEASWNGMSSFFLECLPFWVYLNRLSLVEYFKNNSEELRRHSSSLQLLVFFTLTGHSMCLTSLTSLHRYVNKAVERKCYDRKCQHHYILNLYRDLYRIWSLQQLWKCR